MRLIDADAYIEKNECCGYLDEISVKKFNEITPTVDAVEVVRCRDCVFWANDSPEATACICKLRAHNELTPPEGFCSYGRRKEKTDG